MTDGEFEQFIRAAKQAKAQKRLHPNAQSRLGFLLSCIYPDDIVVSEVSLVYGGRNDLAQFVFNGRRIVFEFFFSVDQIPQDLRLLEQAIADVKVAILLDSSIDPKLARECARKKPNQGVSPPAKACS